MSDDFTQCCNCGCNEPRCKLPQDIIEETIKALKDKEELFADDILEAAEKIKEAQEMDDAALIFCEECGEWTTFKNTHVEYHDGGYEINGHFVKRK